MYRIVLGFTKDLPTVFLELRTTTKNYLELNNVIYPVSAFAWMTSCRQQPLGFSMAFSFLGDRFSF